MGRNLYDLIVDNAIGIGDVCQKAEQVCCNLKAIHLDGEIWPDVGWHVDDIHIDKLVGTNSPIPDGQVFVTGLEVVDAK